MALLYTTSGNLHREWSGVRIPTHIHPYNGQFNFVAWEVSEVSNFETFLKAKIISEKVPTQTLLPVFRYKPSQVILA